MKIVCIDIKKLYGKYDYQIPFNEDLTILYGHNGCGKTTILNILSYIIRGEIRKLFIYDFKEIVVHYSEDKGREFISISKEKNKYKLSYKGTIENFDADKIKRYEMSSIRHNIVNKYYGSKILNDIKLDFNCVYLPINRVNTFVNIEDFSEIGDYEDIEYMYRMYISRKKFNDNKDIALEKVKNLVKDFSLQSIEKIEKENNAFKNNILSSLISLENYGFDRFIKSLKRNNYRTILEKKEQYIKILKDNKLMENEVEYRNFFDKLLNSIKNREKNSEIEENLIFSICELYKVEKVIEYANELEEKKKKILLPIKKFCDVINDFFSINGIIKRIEINNGEIQIFNGYEKITDLFFLSSGEKQLITFYANLLFGVDQRKTSIVIVDEPELSLHLSWQRMFIKKSLEVGKGVQLIFATHSPEIIGKYGNYAYEITKVVN